MSCCNLTKNRKIYVQNTTVEVTELLEKVQVMFITYSTLISHALCQHVWQSCVCCLDVWGHVKISQLLTCTSLYMILACLVMLNSCSSLSPRTNLRLWQEFWACVNAKKCRLCIFYERIRWTGCECCWKKPALCRTCSRLVEQKRNVMAHAQKPDLVFQRNGRVHLYRRGCQFSRLLATEVCASAVVMLDRPCPIQCTTAGYPLHSPFSPSLLHPYVSVCHHIPFLLYFSNCIHWKPKYYRKGGLSLETQRRNVPKSGRITFQCMCFMYFEYSTPKPGNVVASAYTVVAGWYIFDVSISSISQ